MLRDFKFLRRTSGKNEEAENVPISQKDCPVIRTPSDSLRSPFNTIQEPAQNPKPEQEFSSRGKVEKTPSKAKGKASDYAALPLRTPDKQAPKNRFGWAQKNESGATSSEDLGNLSAQVSNRGVGNGGFGTTTPRITRTITRAPVPSFSESNSIQNTPTKSVSKPPNSSLRSKADGVIGARPGNPAALYKGLPMSSGTSAVVNSVEVPHFDLKEDPSFWMEHNVQVLLRVRPLNSMERSTNGYNRCLKQESAQTIAWIGHPDARFTFDHVACETVDQEMLFRMACLPMVENCLSGYNSCMFAYGQTGSGKTYTMLGEIENLEAKPSPHRGMTPRIFEFLFARIQAEEESRRDEQLKYNCKCSFLEIYNEQITDLLDPSSTNLLLREDNKKGVYVENLSEFEVRTVSDILSLLIEGSGNRKVAATNMNRESSRSHSVFTCVIESRWEKDSTTNLRFARLNLVDLAGSERQKTSGAEGERLKEAANINKSLSTLGHVIMVLVDVAQGKQRHIPYRDSRLTYLLQDSLGGNSKTMIIANVSPSICSSPETLNTLKFAQRAKMIKNNAVVNEDSTGDVASLQHQIRILKEELSIAKRQNVQNVSRALSFGGQEPETSFSGHVCDMDLDDDDLLGNASKGSVRMSTKQFKCLETTLAGALRREQMAEASIKQLEAEIGQLNRLVRQREEDSRSSKMMLRFREDKIQRMESVVSNSISSESYLVEENKALCEEIQTLQAKLDRNPEVTRFALENIRLLDQIRRFQDFYEEGEREILISEVSNLRDQLLQFLDGNLRPSNSPKWTTDLEESSVKKNESLHFELEKTLSELEDCTHNLKSCLNENAKLSRGLESMRSDCISVKSLPVGDDDGFKIPNNTTQIEEIESKSETLITENAEQIMNLQLELDILKIILNEERSSGGKTEERATQLNSELDSVRKQYHDVKTELEEAKMVIEALESQQILAIEEMEDLRKNNHRQMHLLSKQEVKVNSLKEQLSLRELKDVSSSKKDASVLKDKVKKMQCSLEKAKKLNTWYENDREHQTSNDEEMDEIQKQVEAETAEVIVCLEEELGVLQREVQESHLKELEMKNSLTLIEAELKEAREQVNRLTDDKHSLSEEWSLLTTEIEEVLTDGCELLNDASDQLEDIASSVPQKRIWISENVSKMARIISEKELLIEELRGCLEDANNTRSDVENMLRTLRGATVAITEAHQNDILHLRSKLSAKASTIENLKSEILNASNCATVAFVVVNRLAEVNRGSRDELRGKNVQIVEQERQIQCLREELMDEQERNSAIEEKLQDVEEKCISAATEKLAKLKTGVSSLISCINSVSEQYKSPEVISVEEDGHDERIAPETHQDVDFDSNESESSHGVGKQECPGRDTTILEMESALQRLKDIKLEMEKLRKESREMSDSEQQTRESLKLATAEILDLQDIMNKFEGEAKLKIEAANQKLEALDQLVLEANSLSSEMKEELETEVDGAKLVAVQNAAEAACILSKFEEAQDTINEADIMINGLVLENERMKLEGKKMKKTNRALINEVQSLQSNNNLKNQQCHQLSFDLAETEALVTELEGVIAETHTAFEENLVLLASDFHDIKGQLFDSSKLVKKWLEGIWSEIVGKDCAVSVLHLCHMGILLETVTGLNAENGLLQHGLCESNAAISDLRERNNKSIKELEICRVIKGKLLADIKNSFDRVSKKEDETHKLSFKLTSFDKKILDLQIQEEAMLERSNCIGSQLSLLTKELDLSNRNLEATIRDQEQAFRSQSEFLMADLLMKEFKSLILASTLGEVALGKAEAEKERFSCVTALEQLKEELVLFMVNEEFQCEISTDKDTEISRQLSDLDRENLSLQNDVALRKNRSNELGCELRRKETELARVALGKSDVEREHFRCVAALEELKEELVLVKVNEEFQREISTDKDTEVSRQLSDLDRENLSLQNNVALLNSRSSELVSELRRKEHEFTRVALRKAEAERELFSCVTVLEELKEELVIFMVNEEFQREFSSDMEAEVSRRISDLDRKNLNLQTDVALLKSRSSKLESELRTKETELSRVISLEKENALLSIEIDNLKAENHEALSLSSRATVFEAENHTLRDEVSALESRIASLQTVLEVKTSELRKIQESQYAVTEQLCLKSQELESYGNGVGALREENLLLRDELKSLKRSIENCFDSADGKSLHALPEEEEGSANPGQMLQEIREVLKKKAQEFADELDGVKSENSSLQSELERKEEILKGLLFDLSLLQEAASNTKDQKDEIEEIMASLEALEDELSAKTSELEEVSAVKGNLEAESREKAETISALESAIAEESRENAELRAKLEDAMAGRSCVEEELAETKKARDGLEAEVLGMEAAIDRLSDSIEELRSDMAELEGERDELQTEAACLKERLEAEQARADESDAIAKEAQLTAESEKQYAEEKEAEVKLLERSVEELESTINVLEDKVEIVKGEAERQRLQREELEMELHKIKQQFQNVTNADAETRRYLEQTEQNLQEAHKKIQALESDLAEKDTELTQFKAHISELNLHAEAQASEYKQKFKALEAMAENIRPDTHFNHALNSSSPKKSEKYATRPRGSGSPFKCIGLGLTQQIKSERDEELSAARLRIEELESLSASRQKEIFTLNARLATADSMTHDVIRDLLGVKLDMTAYMSLMNNQEEVQKITEKARLHNLESQELEHEVVELKKKLTEFIEERRGWLKEIDRKQAELVAAQISLEKLRQHEQLLRAENEMLKMDNINHKTRLTELEGEIKQLSGHQNIHQRIHHPAKIKEENNVLKIQNEELNTKLRRAEHIISRVKEELAAVRISNGKNPKIDFDEERRLSTRLKQTEEEKMQLAQKLLGLCTSVLKVAGITKPVSEISPSVAEEALEQIKSTVTSMDRELHDLKYKNKITNERMRLFELMPQTSPIGSRGDENRQTPRRASQSPYFSPLDR